MNSIPKGIHNPISDAFDRAGAMPISGSLVGLARTVSAVALGTIGILAFILVGKKSFGMLELAGRNIIRGPVEVISGIPLIGQILCAMTSSNYYQVSGTHSLKSPSEEVSWSLAASHFYVNGWNDHKYQKL